MVSGRFTSSHLNAKLCLQLIATWSPWSQIVITTTKGLKVIFFIKLGLLEIVITCLKTADCSWLLLHITITDYDYRLQLQITITDYDYRLRLQITITDYVYRLRIQITITDYDYRLRLQITITDYDYRLWFQIMITDYDYKVNFISVKTRGWKQG